MWKGADHGPAGAAQCKLHGHRAPPLPRVTGANTSGVIRRLEQHKALRAAHVVTTFHYSRSPPFSHLAPRNETRAHLRRRFTVAAAMADSKDMKVGGESLLICIQTRLEGLSLVLRPDADVMPADSITDAAESSNYGLEAKVQWSRLICTHRPPVS